MAENTTSPDASLETPQDGQSHETSEQRPPSQPEQAQAKPVNLYELPEFREFQSKKDRELRQMRDESQRQMAQLQAQLEALQMRDMPDEERTQHEIRKRDAYIQQLQGEMQSVRAEQARVAALTEISRESGAPLDALMEADNPDDAWRKALRWAKDNLTKAQANQVAEQAAEQRANTVDIGRGRPTSQADDVRRMYAEALENNDGAGIYAARIRAQREGITL